MTVTRQNVVMMKRAREGRSSCVEDGLLMRFVFAPLRAPKENRDFAARGVSRRMVSTIAVVSASPTKNSQ